MLRLRTASLDLSGGVPEEVLLFDDGPGLLQDGSEYLVDRESFDLIRRWIQAIGNDIAWDYEHALLTGKPAPASGWIPGADGLRYEPGVGIWARVDWTEKAAGHLARREYRYHSPVFWIREADKRVVGLHSVALTNTPKTMHITPLVAKATGGQPAGGLIMLQMLIAKLGLPETAKEEQVLAAIQALVAKVKTPGDGGTIPKALADALDLKDGDGVSAAVAAANALKQHKKASASAAELAALQQEIRGDKVTAAVAKALADGKLTPDQQDWATKYATDDLEGFELFVSKAPLVVPLGKLPGKQREAESAALDESTLAVAKAMGVTPEDLKTYGDVTIAGA